MGIQTAAGVAQRRAPLAKVSTSNDSVFSSVFVVQPTNLSLHGEASRHCRICSGNHRGQNTPSAIQGEASRQVCSTCVAEFGRLRVKNKPVSVPGAYCLSVSPLT